MDVYSLKAIAEQKIAEDRREAARYWQAVRAEKAGRETRQVVGFSLAGSLRALAVALGFGSPTHETKVPA